MTPAIRERWMAHALEVGRRAHELFDLIEAENSLPGAPCSTGTAQAIIAVQRASNTLVDDARACAALWAALWAAGFNRARTEARGTQ